MVRYSLTALAIVGCSCLLCPRSTAADATESNAVERPPLGLNLAGVTDWSSEIVFVDIFKAARPWISQAQGKPWGQGGKLDVNENGDVQSLRDGQYAETVVFTDFEDRFQAGVYACLYDGDGELGFAGDANVTLREAGRLLVDIRPKQGSLFARITRTNPKDALRNIRLIMPGHEETYEEQPFYPPFVERWQGFSVFRYMDWGNTNNSEIRQWSERPKPAAHSQAMNGMSVEYMVALSNQTGVAPWFCMPHLADDEYVREFARLAKEKLKDSRRVYVEYSNECWNGQFAQARHCQEQGKKQGLSDNAYEAQLRFYAKRSLEMFTIWRDVFDDDERLICVLCVQSANPWTGETVLAWEDAARQADAIGIAPYFGHRWGDPRKAEQTAGMSPAKILKGLDDDLAESRKHMEAYAALAKQHGVELIAYEGGQHLVGHGGAENNQRLTELLHAVNRRPEMKDIYLRHLDDWRKSGGGLYCVFSSMGRYSKWGSWGLLEHPAQRSTAPKFQAIQEYLKDR